MTGGVTHISDPEYHLSILFKSICNIFVLPLCKYAYFILPDLLFIMTKGQSINW